MNKLPSVLRNKIDKSITMTLDQPKYTLIWLHGLGDSSEGFYQYFLHPKSPLYSGAKIKLLQAPQRQVTINEGYLFNSWYDIKSLTRNATDSELYNMKEVQQSYSIIDKQVNSECQYWLQQQLNSLLHPRHRIYVGGFSQGCAMSLYYGLQTKNPIAGIVGLSGYLFKSAGLNNLGKTNIMLQHGKADEVLPLNMAQNSYKRIIQDSKVTYKSVEGLPHTVTIEQLMQMNEWLTESHKELHQFYSKK